MKVNLIAILVLSAAAGMAQGGPGFVPNGAQFPNPGGTSNTYSTTGKVDLTGLFFRTSHDKNAPTHS